MGNESHHGQGGNDSGSTPAADKFEPITTQDELNRVIADRVQRERAKYSDYKDLQAKAKRLDELEDANRSEAEKSATKIAELEKAAANARRDALRFKVASKYGIGDEDTDLFLTGEDEPTLIKQAERLAGRVDERKKQGNHVPNEGKTPQPSDDPNRAWARSVFGGGD